MRFYVSPQHVQTVHYYFFCLGMISLTAGIMHYFETAFSIIFLVFYAVHSAISWQTALFVHNRMKDIVFINSFRYAANHIVLTFVSVGSAIGLDFLMGEQYSSLIYALTLINFFVVFLAAIWFAIVRFDAVNRLFEWYDLKRFQKAKGILMQLRKEYGLELVSDSDIKSYRPGLNSGTDGILLRVMDASDGRGKELPHLVKEFELELFRGRTEEMKAGMRKMVSAGITRSNEKLVSGQLLGIKHQEQKMMEYEKSFFRKFRE